MTPFGKEVSVRIGGKQVLAEFYGFLKGERGSADGEYTVVRLPGDRLLRVVHYTKVADDEVWREGRIYHGAPTNAAEHRTRRNMRKPTGR